MSARAVAALPAIAHDAELAATQLGSAALASEVEQCATLLTVGELEPSHPWPAALVWRRVRDLRDPAAVATDDVLVPLLATSGAAELLRAVAERDPSRVLSALADALEPDPLDTMRPDGGETRDELLARYTGVPVEEAAHERRRWRLARAVPRPGVEFGYTCASGEHSWLGTHGLDERCPYCGEPPARWERPFQPFPGQHRSPFGTRRQLQRLRRRVAVHVARLDGTPEPPAGKGRWPGSRNVRTLTRRRQLAALWPTLTPAERKPAALAERYAVSLATAKRDAAAVRTGSV